MAGEKGELGASGNDGDIGPPGRAHTTVFAIHSFSSTVPTCPSESRPLWVGYSLGPSTSGYPAVSGLATPSNCLRQFAQVMTLSNLHYHTQPTTYWHGAEDVDPAGGQKGAELVGRCSICELERTLLTLHSQTTQLPVCPSGWSSLWEGFSYVTTAVSHF